MDSIDFHILEILQREGRIPMKKLAEQVNMSTPAVIERVKKLEEKQSIMGYKAVIRPDRIGREVSAFILVSVERGQREAFYRYIRENDNVIEAHELAGRFTAQLTVSCPDMEEFLKTVYDLYDIGTTETYVITDLIKSGVYKRAVDTRNDGRSFYSPFKEGQTKPGGER